MANYTWKMWNIPGDELETSMVWADRFHHAYTKAATRRAAARGLSRLRSAQVRGPHARQGHPVPGVSRSTAGTRCGTRWSRRSTVVRDRDRRDPRRAQAAVRADWRAASKYYFADYHTVFCSIDIDELWGEDTLPYTGPDDDSAAHSRARAARFPDGAESLHYSSCEFQTRVTEMKVITRHESPDTLILIEVPVLPGAAQCFPTNTIDYALEHNLFAEKAYPQQSEQAFATYHALRRSRKEDSQPAVRRPPRGVQVLGHAGDGELRVSKESGVRGGLATDVSSVWRGNYLL